MSDRLERNRQTVVAFYDLMFNRGRAAADPAVGEERQHHVL